MANSLPFLNPYPNQVTVHEGRFELNADTTLVFPDQLATTARLAQRWLSTPTGYPLNRAKRATKSSIVFAFAPKSEPLGAEGYRLIVKPGRVEILGRDESGVFYGLQTLRQLLPTSIFAQQIADSPGGWFAPCVEITDQPRFGWRGAHMDVGRHFMPKAFVKKFIDLLAVHKLNTLHWHLSEDQGWRIEIKKYPKLTEIGAWRPETVVGHAGSSEVYDGTPHGGFYTQNEIREVVAYAAERHVTIVPEIDMPGHMQAAVASYPEFGNTGKNPGVWTSFGVTPHVLNLEPKTIQFMKDVLSEVMDLFPGKFIHIGGDECPRTEWEQSPAMQAIVAREGLKDVHHLQAWLNKQLDEFIAAHGRRMIGWDEILEGGLAPGAAVMSWRGEQGGIDAATQGHDVVMAPGGWTYFDHYQSEDRAHEPLAIGGFTSLEKVYGYEPVPKELDATKAKHVLGSQFQLWSEYIDTPMQMEYMAYPRGCALAEVLWEQPGNKDWKRFQRILPHHLERLKQLDVNFRPLDGIGWAKNFERKAK